MFIMEDPINLSEFFSKKTEPTCGAVASFVGVVRNHDHGKPVQKLYYECYTSMADKQIEGIIENTKKRWPIEDVQVLHRIGWLNVGEAAVVISVSSAHRDEAFAACRYIIDEIKTLVPIWKKEVFEDGTSEWVLCTHQEVLT